MTYQSSHIPEKNQTTFNNDFLDTWLPLLTKAELRVYISLKRHEKLSFPQVIKFSNLSMPSAKCALQTLVYKQLVIQNEKEYSLHPQDQINV